MSAEPRLVIFHDRGCPFTHRVLALVAHLGVSAERRESLIGEKPEGLEAYSSSLSIPLLVHGDLVIGESRVMLEHLAEHYGFEDAYPADLPSRTRHRHAMALTDETLAPLLMAAGEVRSARVVDALDALEAAIGDAEPYACLLTFQVAPVWLAFRRLRPSSEVTRAVEARPALCRWLDAATRIESISETSPDPQTQARDVERARDAGLIQF